MVFWCTGIRVSLCPGVQVSWCPGVLVSWCSGVLVSWCPGGIIGCFVQCIGSSLQSLYKWLTLHQLWGKISPKKCLFRIFENTTNCRNSDFCINVCLTFGPKFSQEIQNFPWRCMRVLRILDTRIHYTVHPAHCILYTVFYAVHSMYTVHCTQYTVHSMYSA